MPLFRNCRAYVRICALDAPIRNAIGTGRCDTPGDGSQLESWSGMTRAVLMIRWALLVAVTVFTIWLSARILFSSVDPWNWIIPVATLLPAWIVLLRRDWHAVGWLLLVVSAIQAAQFVEVDVVSLLPPAWLAWVYTVLNVAFWSAMAVLVAVFPDGVGHQEGGPRVADRVIVHSTWVMTVFSALLVEVQATGWSGETDPPLYDNPLGFGFIPSDAGIVLTFASILAFIAATVTLVVRTRRATGAVRQQFRWVLFPFSVLIFGVPIAITITEFRGDPGGEWVIALLGYIAIPICFGVAMTRYRLYDIGKIVSRTITYTMVLVVLGALYFGTITLVTTLLPTRNSLAVAGATLAAAALFNPLRQRIQLSVDRRFNRSAYQAEIISDEFAAKLRESLTIDELTRLWTSAVIDHLQPATSGVWLSNQGSETTHAKPYMRYPVRL